MGEGEGSLISCIFIVLTRDSNIAFTFTDNHLQDYKHVRVSTDFEGSTVNCLNNI